MGDCDVCSGDDKLSFTCNECGGTYCSDHRLPEAHNCSGTQKPEFTQLSVPTQTLDLQDEQQGWIGTLLTVLFSPVIILVMVLGWVNRHRILSLVVVLAAAVGGLAATGQLESVTDDASSTIEDAAHAGGSAIDGVGNSFSQNLSADRVETLVHERINEIRANRSLRTLDHDSQLREIASKYSKRMATEGFYSHTDPRGNNFEDRYAAAGYNCRVQISDNRYATGAENIMQTYAFANVETEDGIEEYDSEKELANAIVEAWMESSGHRKNILQSYWRNEGIGVYIVENPDGEGKLVYATQNFC